MISVCGLDSEWLEESSLHQGKKIKNCFYKTFFSAKSTH